MNKTNEANYINDEFINLKIERAFSGISYIRVENSGNFYAELKGKIYTVKNVQGINKGKRTLRAVKVIFTGLIDKYQRFECDDVIYYVNKNTGNWIWTAVPTNKSLDR